MSSAKLPTHILDSILCWGLIGYRAGETELLSFRAGMGDLEALLWLADDLDMIFDD